MLLDRLNTVAREGFLPLLAITATKVAALNLIPLPTLNGGQALVSLLLGPTNTTPKWVAGAQAVSAWATIFFVLLWLGAIASYL